MRRLWSGLATAGVAAALTLVGVAPAATAKGGEIGGEGSLYLLANTLSPRVDVAFNYGRPGDQVYVGDWDGDGRDTLAVRRGSKFYVTNSLTGGEADRVFNYGRADDTILVGDWNGDGKDTFAVRRGKTYHVKNSLTGGAADRVIQYGRVDDEVLVGDWDANGTDTFTVRRGKTYYVKNVIRGGDADRVITYGRDTDQVLVGDWNGDRRDTFGVRRGSVYHLKNSISGGNADVVVNFGTNSDAALVGDWNGDGKDTIGLRRTGSASSIPTPTPGGMSPEARAALNALSDIRITSTEAPGYQRSEFGSGWSTVGGCSVRHRVLARDMTDVIRASNGCTVTSGVLNDPYTATRINFTSTRPNDVQIDHVVAVSAAWKMGANRWTYDARRAFYNDQDNLLAVDGPTNASKGDKTLGQWRPPNSAFHCEYTITYIEVTDDYDLALKPADASYAREKLPSC